MTKSVNIRVVTLGSGTIKISKTESANKKSVSVNKHFANLQKFSDCSLLNQNNKRKRKTLNCELVNCAEISINKEVLPWTNYFQNMEQ